MPPQEQTPQPITPPVELQPQPTTTPPPVPEASPTPSPTPPPAPAKKHIPKWLKIVGIIAIVFVVLIVALVIATTLGTKAPQKISDQFVNEVQAGNTSAAYGLTSSAFQKATSEASLDELIKQVGPALQGEEKVTGRAVEKSTKIPETAVLVYTVKTSNGDKYIKIELQKSDGVWQVINFRSADNALNTTVE